LDEKRYVDDDDTCTPIYYLLNAFNNSLPNIQVKSTTQETENISKSLKPKNTYGFNWSQSLTINWSKD
jgi:hypothetical protein